MIASKKKRNGLIRSAKLCFVVNLDLHREFSRDSAKSTHAPLSLGCLLNHSTACKNVGCHVERGIYESIDRKHSHVTNPVETVQVVFPLDAFWLPEARAKLLVFLRQQAVSPPRVIPSGTLKFPGGFRFLIAVLAVTAHE